MVLFLDFFSSLSHFLAKFKRTNNWKIVQVKISTSFPVNFRLIRRRRCCHLCRRRRFFIIFGRFCWFQRRAAWPLTVQKLGPVWIVDDARAISPMTETVFVAAPNAFTINFYFSFHQRINIRGILARNCARTKTVFACFAFFLKKRGWN